MTVQSAREVIEGGVIGPGRLAHVAKYIGMINNPKSEWERFEGFR